MIRITVVVALFTDLPEPELHAWIARGWVRPEREPSGDWLFAEIDVARTRLVHDLRRQLDIDEDTLPVVLSLVDQVYDLRRALRTVMDAIESQPEHVRAAVRGLVQTMRHE